MDFQFWDTPIFHQALWNVTKTRRSWTRSLPVPNWRGRISVSNGVNQGKPSYHCYSLRWVGLLHNFELGGEPSKKNKVYNTYGWYMNVSSICRMKITKTLSRKINRIWKPTILNQQLTPSCFGICNISPAAALRNHRFSLQKSCSGSLGQLQREALSTNIIPNETVHLQSSPFLKLEPWFLSQREVGHLERGKKIVILHDFAETWPVSMRILNAHSSLMDHHWKWYVVSTSRSDPSPNPRCDAKLWASPKVKASVEKWWEFTMCPGFLVFQWNSAWELCVHCWQGKMQPLRWQPSQLLTSSGTNCAKINPSLFANITPAPAALRSRAAWQSLLPLLFRLTFPQEWLRVFQMFATNMISPPHQESIGPHIRFKLGSSTPEVNSPKTLLGFLL